MAIREHFRRALRRSSASSGDVSGDEPTVDNSSTTTNMGKTTTAASSQTSLSSKSSSSLLTRTFTWGSRDKNKDKESRPKKTKGRKRPVHPSEKPLTAQNIKHQEMLSQFTWTFGASNPEQIEDEDFYGISPCCTRAPSIAGDSDDSNASTNGGDSDGVVGVRSPAISV